MEVDEGGGTTNGAETRYANVGFKKRTGHLRLTDDHLEFTIGRAGAAASDNDATNTTLRIVWDNVLKHQVSPATFTKAHLLRLILKDPVPGTKKDTLAFSMEHRPALEAIRNDVSRRLNRRGITSNGSGPHATNENADMATSPRKRPYAELTMLDNDQPHFSDQQSYGTLDPTALAVARSTILAANPTLRQQHRYLVMESQMISEDDFWATHHHLLEDEYAKISGLTQAGNSSVLQSHVPSSGKVQLGVQQMRQIFILYPAVHKAYEEKVPLELSDEQFWRKYLESEFFHRDRGRLGTVAKNHAAAAEQQQQTGGGASAAAAGNAKQSLALDLQDARAAAVGTDDLFSRYDQKIRQMEGHQEITPKQRQWGRRLAVGQFDLASTFETERGKLLEGPKDNYPPNQSDDGKGARVIQKYNRHWAVVLYPDEAIAGSDLAEVSRRSHYEVQPGSRDAYANGGVDEEMRRLVAYAEAPAEQANHAVGIDVDSGGYEELTLRNIEAYYAGNVESTTKNKNMAEGNGGDAKKRHLYFAQVMAATARDLVQKLEASDSPNHLPGTCYPNPDPVGTNLLLALTKLMEKSSQTDGDSLKLVRNLPEDFRKNLQTYFRRSSELLRHFFGLRQLAGDDDDNSKKLARIVAGMESFYREMVEVRRKLPQTDDGELMRKMCLPLMDQLNDAIKLYTGGGGGGFVAVS